LERHQVKEFMSAMLALLPLTFSLSQSNPGAMYFDSDGQQAKEQIRSLPVISRALLHSLLGRCINLSSLHERVTAAYPQPM
jgi:hypothetical protein